MFRQDPGKINAMGSVKINFPNPHAVYMHDTPQQSLFGKLLRFESSGCVRVQNVRDLVAWLAKDTPGWDRRSVERVIENGDRTNRKKARLKYLVDDWGIPKILEETAKKMTFELRHFPLELCEPSLPKTKHGHLGIHEQSDGKHYIGVLTPVGRMSVAQMHALAGLTDSGR